MTPESARILLAALGFGLACFALFAASQSAVYLYGPPRWRAMWRLLTGGEMKRK